MNFARAVAFSFVFAGLASAQKLPSSPRTARYSLFAELGGSAGLYSLNFERRLAGSLLLRVAGSTYASIEFGDQPNRRYRLGTLMLGSSTGPGTSHWDTGIGLSVGNYRLERQSSAPTTTVCLLTSAFGYRFQHENGGPLFRLVLAPRLGLRGSHDDRALSLWPGISGGFAF